MLPLLVAVFACAGCFSAGNQAKLKTTAAFDFSCPQDQLQIQLLTGNWAVEGAQAGAEGCGKKARYILNFKAGGWVMNTVQQ